jgi:hypothetical protein
VFCVFQGISLQRILQKRLETLKIREFLSVLGQGFLMTASLQFSLQDLHWCARKTVELKGPVYAIVPVMSVCGHA